MRDSEMIEKLNSLGLNAYEAKSYVALLRLSTGGGYAIAKRAGIPTSKVYEALSMLAAKGFIVSDGMKKPSYTPVPPTKVLGDIKDDMASKIELLIPELEKTSLRRKEMSIQSIKGIRAVYSQFRRLFKRAEKKILLTAWPEDLAEFGTDLQDAAGRLELIILANGPFELPGAEIFLHRRTDMLKRYIPGRWLLAVSGSGEGIAAFFDEHDHAQCIWTEDPGIYQIFHDHILHDVSLNYVISKLPKSQQPLVEDELFELRKKLSFKWH